MTKKKISRPQRKFSGIAKVGFNTSTKQNICVKYRFNDVNKFIIFINNQFNPLWINIYYRTGEQKNKLAYTWGRNKGLQSAY
jgi:heterodisulfide reductase subunit A-like polyferredoxin